MAETAPLEIHKLKEENKNGLNRWWFTHSSSFRRRERCSTRKKIYLQWLRCAWKRSSPVFRVNSAEWWWRAEKNERRCRKWAENAISHVDSNNCKLKWYRVYRFAVDFSYHFFSFLLFFAFHSIHFPYLLLHFGNMNKREIERDWNVQVCVCVFCRVLTYRLWQPKHLADVRCDFNWRILSCDEWLCELTWFMRMHLKYSRFAFAPLIGANPCNTIDQRS